MQLLYDWQMDVLDIADVLETRRRNFTPLEVETLLRCIEKYKLIIDNKVANSKTNREKKIAWHLVGKDFNSTPGVGNASVIQLMNLYKNLKKKAKAIKSEDKMTSLQNFGLIKVVKGNFSSLEHSVSGEADNLVNNQDLPLSSCLSFLNSSSEPEAEFQFEEESLIDEDEITKEIILMDIESSSSVDTHPIEKTVENSEEQNKQQQNPIKRIHTVKVETENSLNQSICLKEKLLREEPELNVKQTKNETVGLKEKHLREEHELNLKQRKEEHGWKKQKYELEIEDQKLKVKIHLEQLRLLKALNQKINRDELLKFAFNDISL